MRIPRILGCPTLSVGHTVFAVRKPCERRCSVYLSLENCFTDRIGTDSGSFLFKTKTTKSVYISRVYNSRELYIRGWLEVLSSELLSRNRVCRTAGAQRLIRTLIRADSSVRSIHRSMATVADRFGVIPVAVRHRERF